MEEVHLRPFVAACLLAGAFLACGTAIADDAEPAPQGEASSCVNARSIRGWSRIDDRTLVLRSASRKYRVSLVNICREADWAFAARVDHYGMCLRPGDALIFGHDGHPLGARWPHWGARWPERGFEQRCYISAIELLPPGWTPPPKK